MPYQHGVAPVAQHVRLPSIWAVDRSSDEAAFVLAELAGQWMAVLRCHELLVALLVDHLALGACGLIATFRLARCVVVVVHGLAFAFGQRRQIRSGFQRLVLGL